MLSNFFGKNKLGELPLDIRLNSYVQMNGLSFELNAEALMIQFPGEEHHIKNIGVIEFGETRLVRCYFSSVNDGDALIFIEIAISKDNPKDILHRRLYRLDGWIPPDSEDWFEYELPNWVNEGGLIGGSAFMIGDEEAGEKSAQYDRLWVSTPREGDHYVSPVQYTEKLYTDTDEKPNSEIKHQAMLYAREVSPDYNEYCMPSFFEGGPLEVGIQIWIGVDLAESDVSFY